jgi:hypothetical protein
VQDRDFVAELSWMGHGLQMWLQTMWFLSQSKGFPTIILDEPDVYLHADLQRKLIRLLHSGYPQVIIATHSIEIMAEVEAQDILIINRLTSNSVYADSMPSVQRVIDEIGGIHNIQLARLWNSQRCLLVEGKDVAYLKILQNHFFSNMHEAIDAIPNMQLGGWGGWNYAFGSKMLLTNAVGEKITTYCIFDSDYHTLEEISERYQQANQRGIQLHIWKMKEIENYFIVTEAVERIITSLKPEGKKPPTNEEIDNQIEIIISNEKNKIFDAISSEYCARDRAGGVTKANRIARSIIDNAWESKMGRRAIVSEKTVISQLSKWSQMQYGVALNPSKILKSMNRNEIDNELLMVMRAIENNSPFLSS